MIILILQVKLIIVKNHFPYFVAVRQCVAYITFLLSGMKEGAAHPLLLTQNVHSRLFRTHFYKHTNARFQHAHLVRLIF